MVSVIGRFRGCFAVMAVLAQLVAIRPVAAAQAQPYPDSGSPATYEKLRHQIAGIKLFDNHGHPGLPDDADVDAMSIPADSSLPFRLREGNSEFAAAARALFGYPYADFASEHVSSLVKEKQRLRESLGAAYFSHILDQVGIETAVANRVSMPTYLQTTRFRWVFFVDAFLFPLNNQAMASKNPDLKLNVPLEEKLLKRYMAQAHLNQLPGNFAEYLAFASSILEANKKAGAVGIKFEIAYFRPLLFSDPGQEQAATTYSKYVHGGTVPEADYRDLQDFMFRYLLGEAGRLHLPVQIHTAVGAGDYFNLTGGNVMNLENILRDPRYENVTFVLLHGGFPFEREAIWLAARKNVYLDSSLMGLFLYPRELKNALRQWFELFPEKVVFGSDTFPISDSLGAEESYWLATESARSAVAGALAEMVSEKEISEQQALAMAHAYLHDTASRIYSGGF
jgi:predicted TIM-barrel fold metal-dependent hydrolase